MDSPTAQPAPKILVGPLIISVALISIVAVALLIYQLIIIVCCESAQRRYTSTFVTNTRRSAQEETTKHKRINQDVLDSIPILCYGSSITGLVEKPMFGAQQTVCAVCLADMLQEEFVRLLPVCGHIFHLQCIDEWFMAHSNCPICRSEMMKVNKCSFSDLSCNDMDEVLEVDAATPTNRTQFSSGLVVAKRCSSLRIRFEGQYDNLVSSMRLNRSLSESACDIKFEDQHSIKPVDIELGFSPTAYPSFSSLLGRS